MEAVDTYDDDDITIPEATGETAQGKETQKGGIEGFQKMVTERHGGGIRGIAANEDTGYVFVESWPDVTFQGNCTTFEQVAVQRWKNGNVVHERVYYNVPGA